MNEQSNNHISNPSIGSDEDDALQANPNASINNNVVERFTPAQNPFSFTINGGLENPLEKGTAASVKNESLIEPSQGAQQGAPVDQAPTMQQPQSDAQGSGAQQAPYPYNGQAQAPYVQQPPFPYSQPMQQPAVGANGGNQQHGYAAPVSNSPYWPNANLNQQVQTPNVVPYYGFQGYAAPQNSTVPPYTNQPFYPTPHQPGTSEPTHTNTKEEKEDFDYGYIDTPARIAIYDDMKSAPRVIQIQGASTHEYIEHIASLTFKNAKEAGGLIPYTVIREVSENFIHANFQEVIVSIMDKGNTIRFADQGPGIKQKDQVTLPGFSSATEPMKRYIRGVGSGLPIVQDYLDTTHGYIKIEDNVRGGAVVTVSLIESQERGDEGFNDYLVPSLTENEIVILKALLPDSVMGITDMNRATNVANASIHTAFSKMEEAGLVEKVGKKRKLTKEGYRIALSL